MSEERYAPVGENKEDKHVVLVYREDGTLDMEQSRIEWYKEDKLWDVDVLANVLKEEAKRRNDPYWDM